MKRRHWLLASSLPLLVLACSDGAVFPAGDDDSAGDSFASNGGGRSGGGGQTGGGQAGGGQAGGGQSGGGVSRPPEPAPEPEPPPPDDTPRPPSTLPGTPDGGAAGPLSILTAGAWDDNANFGLWPSLRARWGTRSGSFPIALDEQVEANTAWTVPPAAKQTLDVSLVIDTTRSMSDELVYIAREIGAIATRIQQSYPRVQARWSFVVYRDRTDHFLEQHVDFDTDVRRFQQRLTAKNADGGGDFPEAPEAGFDAMNAMTWRADPSTAKLAFWIADAPPHEENLPAMANAVRASKALGVHVYPVASSGIDEHTEYVMRATAQLTGGRYLFLTDDSGIGNQHREPRVPCYHVTKLNELMLRVVDHELTGVHRLPVAPAIIRTTGNPTAGRCQTSNGPATAY